ncbi:endonuclease V [Candidatus Woesearchaeota archaeon]|nr:endonuclease V [Candidatus Woesearchaeota archaeon]
MPDLKKLMMEQKKLHTRLILSDQFDKINLVAGTDTVYIGNKLINTIVIFDNRTKEIIDRVHTCEKVTFPYVGGFLSYREAPSIVKTFSKLTKKPDLLFVRGNGILHPRMFGIACHVGLFLDVPTIGVAKNQLCGNLVENSIYIEKTCVGRGIVSKKNAKPIYISPGHRVSMKSACEITKEWLTDYKMPLPLHKAHSYASKIKNKLKTTLS